MRNADHIRLISRQYHRAGLTERILAACRQAGKDPAHLSRDDLTVFDEFHIGGRKSTRRLADRAGLGAGTRVLDLGCGIGGPARTLAADYGCDVLGIDVTAEYCRAAFELTRRVGLDARVTFQVGDALSIPCAAGRFDVVFTQHVIMNVPAKERLCTEVARVLKPGGRWMLFEVFRGAVEPPHYPVPWADTAACSHLAYSDTFRAAVGGAGLKVVMWDDVSRGSQAWFETAVQRMAEWSHVPSLGIHLLMGDNTVAKARNMVRNLVDDRIRVFEGVAERPAR